MNGIWVHLMDNPRCWKPSAIGSIDHMTPVLLWTVLKFPNRGRLWHITHESICTKTWKIPYKSSKRIKDDNWLLSHRNMHTHTHPLHIVTQHIIIFLLAIFITPNESYIIQSLCSKIMPPLTPFASSRSIFFFFFFETPSETCFFFFRQPLLFLSGSFIQIRFFWNILNGKTD